MAKTKSTSGKNSGEVDTAEKSSEEWLAATEADYARKGIRTERQGDRLLINHGDRDRYLRNRLASLKLLNSQLDELKADFRESLTPIVSLELIYEDEHFVGKVFGCDDGSEMPRRLETLCDRGAAILLSLIPILWPSDELGPHFLNLPPDYQWPLFLTLQSHNYGYKIGDLAGESITSIDWLILKIVTAVTSCEAELERNRPYEFRPHDFRPNDFRLPEFRSHDFVDNDAKVFSVKELCEISGVKNDTLKKYGVTAIARWLTQGQRGKQFTTKEAIKIIEAVRNGSPETKIRKKCEDWLENEIRSKSEVNPIIRTKSDTGKID